jgi:hypothetical protein
MQTIEVPVNSLETIFYLAPTRPREAISPNPSKDPMPQLRWSIMDLEMQREEKIRARAIDKIDKLKNR